MPLLSVEEGAKWLAEGRLVAFPTETVYGLGADANSASAVASIYEAKGRPQDHPLIVHLASGTDPQAWYARDVPDVAYRLIERFWPGPLTLVLQRQAGHGEHAAAGLPTVGVRSPRHDLAQALLSAFARYAAHGGLAAPSANRFGHVSPTQAQHVIEEFGAPLGVVDGGACAIGIESTILDLSRYDKEGAFLLRPGDIDRDALAEVLGEAPHQPDRNAPRVSGSLKAHYAPRKPLAVVAQADLAGVPADAAVWAFGGRPAGLAAGVIWHEAPRAPGLFARDLYAKLRELDASSARVLVIETPPMDAAWEAVRDRLSRAVAGSGLGR